jgi:hypothetical protein
LGGGLCLSPIELGKKNRIVLLILLT